MSVVVIVGPNCGTAIREIIGRLIDRGDSALITDSGGRLTRRYYSPVRGDQILSLFEPRSKEWDYFGEIREKRDIDWMTCCAIPESNDSDGREWREYARTLVRDVTEGLWTAGFKYATTQELCRVLIQEPVDGLERLLDGKASALFLKPDHARMFASIRAIAACVMSRFRYVHKNGGETFSVTEWVEQSPARKRVGAGNMLFVPYDADEVVELRSIISMWISIGIRAALRMEPADDRCLWFVIDAVDSLEPISNLGKAVKRMNEFGGQIILGVNSLESLGKLYGEETDVILKRAEIRRV